MTGVVGGGHGTHHLSVSGAALPPIGWMPDHDLYRRCCDRVVSGVGIGHRNNLGPWLTRIRL